MNRHLLGHLIRFDFQAQRLVMGAWSAALVIQALIFAISPSSVEFGKPAFSWDMAMFIIKGGLMMAVVSYVVHSDSLVGTQAFWMTRPIPRLTLLASKILPSIGWLVVWPALVTASTLTVLGMGPGDALSGARTVAFEQAVALALILMAAVVTANLAQLVIAGIAGFTIVALLNAFVLPAVTVSWPAIGDELGGWQPAVYAVCIVAGATIVAFYQYLTLRAWHTLVFIGLTMAASAFVTQYWGTMEALPYGTTVPGSVWSPAQASLLSGDTEGWIRVERLERGVVALPPGRRRILIENRASGVPDGIALWPVAARSEVTIPGRQPIRWQGWLLPRVSRDQIPGGMPSLSVSAAVDGARFLQPPTGAYYMSTVTELPEEAYQSSLATPASLAADITCDAFRYRIVGRLPLVPGSSATFGGRSIVVVGVGAREWRIDVSLRETLLDESRLVRQATSPIGVVWVLRNSILKEAAAGGWAAWQPQKLTIGFASTGIVNRLTKVSANILNAPAPASGGDTPVVAPTVPVERWVKDAELLLLEPEKLGIVTLPLRIGQLVLPPPPRGR